MGLDMAITGAFRLDLQGVRMPDGSGQEVEAVVMAFSDPAGNRFTAAVPRRELEAKVQALGGVVVPTSPGLVLP